LLTVEVLLVIAVAIGFYKAWNIGANDVANGMGTVVGAGTLTLRQAICLASVFEFLGAFLVGSRVTETIKGGIVPMSIFSENAHLFGVGMLAVALSSAIWLNIATMMSRPVSVTQSTVGGIIGFALVCPVVGGFGCIHWGQLGTIALTWVISPLGGGLGAYLVYNLVVRFVMKHKDPVSRAKLVVPFGFAATLSIIFLSATYKGLPRITLSGGRPEESAADLPLYVLLAITAGIAIAAYAITRIVIHFRVKDRHDRTDHYETVERWFGRLQVMTACYMSFSHGANDVASAIGPLAGSMQAFSGQELSVQAPVSPWLLAFGGAGIVIGLATMGYKVIIAVGKKITEITPTRGFSAEFATASTVLVCSKLGLPISTTFVMVGAILGVGLARSFGAIDLKVVRQIFSSWILTIPCSAVLAATLFWIMRCVVGM
jgi:PiT family inorganic phosphate transporter